jgi:hypothetical protein
MLDDLKKDGQISSEILISTIQNKQKITTMRKAAEEIELLLLRCSKCCGRSQNLQTLSVLL